MTIVIMDERCRHDMVESLCAMCHPPADPRLAVPHVVDGVTYLIGQGLSWLAEDERFVLDELLPYAPTRRTAGKGEYMIAAGIVAEELSAHGEPRTTHAVTDKFEALVETARGVPEYARRATKHGLRSVGDGRWAPVQEGDEDGQAQLEAAPPEVEPAAAPDHGARDRAADDARAAEAGARAEERLSLLEAENERLRAALRALVGDQ